MMSYQEQSTKPSNKEMGIDLWITMPNGMTPNIFTPMLMNWLKSVGCKYCSGVIFNQMESCSEDEVNGVTITNDFEK